MKPRKPLIVLAWSFGLFMLIHSTQYISCLVASALSGSSFESIISGEFSNHLTVLGQGITAAVIGIPCIFLVARFLWRRPWGWVRLRFDCKLLAYGSLFGIGLAALSLLIVGVIGEIQVTATPDRFGGFELFAIVLGALGSVTFTAVAEEFVFRGVAVREWATKWGWPTAALVGGIYFGAMHIIGLLPNISILEVLWVLIAAVIGTILFVALYIRGKSLWLPIGFHAGWNLSLNTLFGVTMSGKDSPFGLFKIEMSGSNLITGGMFGLEASVTVMVLSAILVMILLRYSRSGRPSLLTSSLTPSP